MAGLETEGCAIDAKVGTIAEGLSLRRSGRFEVISPGWLWNCALALSLPRYMGDVHVSYRLYIPINILNPSQNEDNVFKSSPRALVHCM